MKLGRITKKYIKIIGLLPVLAITLALAGCCPKKVNTPIVIKKLTLQELRQNYIHTLRHEGVKVIKIGETMRLIFPSDALFNPYSANIAYCAKTMLKTAVKLINTYRTVKIVVVAYSDNTQNGPYGRKLALTTAQAQNVANYLDNHGVNTRLIYGVGKGAKNPVAINHFPKGRALNRRVEISFRFFPRVNIIY